MVRLPVLRIVEWQQEITVLIMEVDARCQRCAIGKVENVRFETDIERKLRRLAELITGQVLGHDAWCLRIIDVGKHVVFSVQVSRGNVDARLVRRYESACELDSPERRLSRISRYDLCADYLTDLLILEIVIEEREIRLRPTAHEATFGAGLVRQQRLRIEGVVVVEAAGSVAFGGRYVKQPVFHRPPVEAQFEGRFTPAITLVTNLAAEYRNRAIVGGTGRGTRRGWIKAASIDCWWCGQWIKRKTDVGTVAIVFIVLGRTDSGGNLELVIGSERERSLAEKCQRLRGLVGEAVNPHCRIGSKHQECRRARQWRDQVRAEKASAAQPFQERIEVRIEFFVEIISTENPLERAIGVIRR